MTCKGNTPGLVHQKQMLIKYNDKILCSNTECQSIASTFKSVKVKHFITFNLFVNIHPFMQFRHLFL